MTLHVRGIKFVPKPNISHERGLGPSGLITGHREIKGLLISYKCQKTNKNGSLHTNLLLIIYPVDQETREAEQDSHETPVRYLR